jgi:hypothetical protein
MLNRKWSPKRGQASPYSKAQLLVVASSLALGGCGDKSVQTGAPTSSAAPATAPSAIDAKNLQALQEENQRLKAEVASLKEQVADLGQTPQVLLDRVQELVKAESLSEAKTIASKLEQRYGPEGQAKTANAAVAQLVFKLEARKEQTRQLEARGFYALKPSSSVAVNGFVIKVDSLGLGNRWLFNTHDYQYNYRDVQRGEKFVLLKTTLKNTDKSHNPNLPDIAVYAIEGKEMRRVAGLSYEFRRWSNYGSYIGLHHDFKNDFAHTTSIPFTAAASIGEDFARTPFAVVATGHRCHERGEQIGQPEVVYRMASGCGGKASLSTEDFNAGEYRVLAFFNKPKGV